MMAVLRLMPVVALLAPLLSAQVLPANPPSGLLPSVPSAVTTDPLSSQSVFSTPPPVLQSDLVLDSTNIAQSGMACYGNTTTTKSCYSTVLNGAQTILNQSANQTFEALILAATTAGSPAMRGSTSTGHIVPNSIFSLQASQASPTDPSVASMQNNGDFTSVFIRLSDHFAGLACGSNPGGSNCLVKDSSNVAVPFSFVALPASVIFNTETLNTEQDLTTDAGAAASGILATLVMNSGQTVAPEPATLLLVSGGVLVLLRARHNRARSRRVS